jgi:hypothetical protein
MTSEHAALYERLRTVVSRPSMAGGILRVKKSEVTTCLAAIERLSAENEALREGLIAVRAAADHAPSMSSIRRVEWKIKQFDPAIKLVRAVLARTTLKGADQ